MPCPLETNEERSPEDSSIYFAPLAAQGFIMFYFTFFLFSNMIESFETNGHGSNSIVLYSFNFFICDQL